METKSKGERESYQLVNIKIIDDDGNTSGGEDDGNHPIQKSDSANENDIENRKIKNNYAGHKYSMHEYENPYTTHDYVNDDNDIRNQNKIKIIEEFNTLIELQR